MAAKKYDLAVEPEFTVGFAEFEIPQSDTDHLFIGNGLVIGHLCKDFIQIRIVRSPEMRRSDRNYAIHFRAVARRYRRGNRRGPHRGH